MVKLYGMQDYGTRLDHMMDLQDLWSTAYAMLTTKGWHSIPEKVQARELEVALRLLGNYMTFNYSELGLARTINDLPKAEDIPEDEEDLNGIK